MDSGFVVQVTSQPGPVGSVKLLRVVEGLVFEGRNVSGFVKPFPVTADTVNETQPLISRGTLLLYDGHVDNRAQLAQALNDHRLVAAPDGDVLLAAAEKWGAGLQQYVVGDYGFVALDTAASTVIAGRDALGVKRVYYHATEREFTVSSSLRLLLAALDSTPDLDSEGIAEFICCGDLHATRTVYSQVHIVPPGHSVVWRSGVTRLVDAWIPAFGTEFTDRPVAELEEECQVLISAAVSAGLRSHGRVCVELSGGLDSSTVAAMAATLWHGGDRGGELPLTLSYTRRRDPPSAESEYRQEVVRACRLPHHTADIDQLEWFGPLVGDVPCEPLCHLAEPAKNQLISDLIARLGLRTCLTGQGGNEVFEGGLDEPFFLADWFRQLRWRQWRHGLRSYRKAGRNNLMRLCRLSITPGSSKTRFRRPHWLTAGEKDLPLDHYSARLAPTSRSRLCPAQAIQLAFIRAAAMGVSRPFPWDERHPLLYRPLVEFTLRVPWDLKTGPDGVRGLHRRATVNLFPERVRLQRKVQAGRSILQDFSRSWRSIKPLAEGRLLADHSFVEPGLFYDACQRMSHGLVAKHEPFTSSWNALVLERWLELHGPSQGDSARREYRRLRLSALSESSDAKDDDKT